MGNIPFYGDSSIGPDIAKLVPASDLQDSYLATFRVSIASYNSSALTNFIKVLKAQGPIQSEMLSNSLAFDGAKCCKSEQTRRTAQTPLR